MTGGNGQERINGLIAGLKERLNTKGPPISYVEFMLTKTGEKKLKAFLAWLKKQHEGEAFRVRPRKHALFGDGEFAAANLYAELLADIGRVGKGIKYFRKVICPIKVDITFNQSLTPESGSHDGVEFRYGVVRLGARPLLYLLHMRLGCDDEADVKIATRD